MLEGWPEVRVYPDPGTQYCKIRTCNLGQLRVGRQMPISTSLELQHLTRNTVLSQQERVWTNCPTPDSSCRYCSSSKVPAEEGFPSAY